MKDSLKMGEKRCSFAEARKLVFRLPIVDFGIMIAAVFPFQAA